MSLFVIPFEKMHGIGNDFIILERRNLPNNINDKLLAELICDRHFGVGADGIIIMDFPPAKEADFLWSYYNSDGSEAQMCGNGMRCFAKYVYERGFTDDVSLTVLTKAGIINPVIQADGTVTVNMGVPKIPNNFKDEIVIDSRRFIYTYVEIGNPHCVIFMDNEISELDFQYFGPKIERHSKFPERINVEFVYVLNNSEIKCRVWERGAGSTLACGTGACAALVAASINKYSNDKATIHLPGGCLTVSWDKTSNNVFLNGPASFIYTGQFTLDPVLISKTTPNI